MSKFGLILDNEVLQILN